MQDWMSSDNRSPCAPCGLPWQPSLPLALLVRGPQRQIVAKQLHDERGILVGIFSHIVKLCNSIFESSAGHLACFLGLTQHLVLEYRKFSARPRRIGCVTAKSVFATLEASS